MRRRLLAAALTLVVGAALVAGCDVDDTYTRNDYPWQETTGPEAAPHHGTPYDSGANLPACSTVYPGDAPSSGVWTIDEQATYEGCLFRGTGITVEADNVILRAMAIVGDRALLVQNNGTGLSIEYAVIIPDPDGTYVGPSGEPCAAAVAYGNFELIGSEVSGCADGLKVSGDVAITGSFIHDLWKGCHPNDPTACTHNDGMQYPENSGAHGTILVTGSAIYLDSCTSNRIAQLKNFQGTAVFDGNFIYGSHGLVMADGTAAMTLTVTDNEFAGSATAGPFTTNSAGTRMIGLLGGGGWTSLTASGNVFEDGSPVPSNFRAEPYTCGAMPPPTTTTTTTTV